jgi:hypothetical protein
VVGAPSTPRKHPCTGFVCGACMSTDGVPFLPRPVTPFWGCRRVRVRALTLWPFHTCCHVIARAQTTRSRHALMRHARQVRAARARRRALPPLRWQHAPSTCVLRRCQSSRAAAWRRRATHARDHTHRTRKAFHAGLTPLGDGAWCERYYRRYNARRRAACAAADGHGRYGWFAWHA